MIRRAVTGLLALSLWGCGSGGDAEEGLEGSVGSRDAAAHSAPPPGALVSVPLTGCTEGTYLAEVDIGRSQTFELAIDTGSTTLGVASATCASCGVSPLYDPGSHAVDEHEAASSLYGDGTDAGATGWSGEIYEDTVTAGGTAGSTSMKIAAIESQRDFFHPITCGAAVLPSQGILGLGPPKDAIAGTDGYFDRLLIAKSLPNVFATQLCDPGGHLWLGGYDPAFTTGPPKYTPFSTSANRDHAYVVDLERVEIGGKSFDVPTSGYGDTVLDTGNNRFFLPPAVFHSVVSAITSSPGFVTAFGADAGGPDAGGSFFSELGDCATTLLTKEQLDATLPALTLVFGASAPVSVKAVATEAYLIPTGGGTVCPGLYSFAPGATYPFAASLGAPILRSSVVIFDRQSGRVGFAPHTPCP